MHTYIIHTWVTHTYTYIKADRQQRKEISNVGGEREEKLGRGCEEADIFKMRGTFRVIIKNQHYM